ncbi:glutamate-cysteine ligase catalytic subunit [Clavulina sp. PMI_390]|nr:glutamate-cysteine ligase catalytic subunit [Clavulina sp. PMI_390]
MGLLFKGKPLTWEESKKYHAHVKEHGITQFLKLWERFKDREGDNLLWGDEIEYMVLSFDPDARSAKLSLRQSEILAKLEDVYLDLCNNTPADRSTIPTFHPEYGRYMLESTPGSPYTASLKDLMSVETNMRYRRKLIRNELNPLEAPITITSYPRLGTPGAFTDPHYDPANAQASHSLFLPDEITNPHVRFPTLTANIRRRRGSKVAINLPIFKDSKTPSPFIDPTIPYDRNIFPEDPEAKNGAALPDHIYMDAMGFGMGCCCLQITFQACNVDEARRVYDALVPVGPVMLALTAASPAYRGYLADVDCRWNVIAGSVDDRTEEERGLKPLKENNHQIPKSRYDSVDSYLSKDFRNRPEYNDVPLPIDEPTYERLRDNGIDELLAKHIAHLFIRDPLVVFSDAIDLDDEKSADHFENIQSTNWQTLRFKPPPAQAPIGWRVEFRSMEVQITDFENAAFSVFIVLLSRAILSFGLNFYIPISKVDENMHRAQQRDAAREQKFWFRRSIYPDDIIPHGHSHRLSPTSALASASPPTSPSKSSTGERDPPLSAAQSRCPSPRTPALRAVEDEYEEMTMAEIINGKKADGCDGGFAFPGLLGVVNAYLNTLNVPFAHKKRMRTYLNLIKWRADGTLQTTATWIRNFIRSHPDYKHDSVVSDEINFDLMGALEEIERGTLKAPELLPDYYLGSRTDDGCL